MSGRRVAWTWLVAMVTTPALPGPASGQEEAEERVIRGRVLDPNGTPVPLALVGLAFSDQSVATDDAGLFTLPVPPGDLYRLVVEQLGYHRIEVRIGEEALGVPLDLRLEPDPIALRGLEVTVDRFEQRRRAFASMAHVVDLEDLAFTTAVDAYDVIRQNTPTGLIPCADAEGVDCMTRRGAVVQQVVCIDDQRAFRGRDALRTYQPHELYMVEVYEWGQFVRVYTRFYVENHMRHPQPILPAEFGC